MIDLYTFKTPNGRKISIALEELGIPYKTHSVDISKGEQFKPEFLAINPNNKIPAIVDHDAPGGRPFALFESGAILLYLAEKTGSLMPADPRGKAEVTQWLMFQMSGLGPTLGQLNHFGRYASAKIPYAIDRFEAEAKRVLGVVEQQLSSRDYLATTYSIADIATYPWLKGSRDFFPELFNNMPNILQYLHRVGSRPAVQRGMQIP
ncbi:glutathione S-transferase family protein [Corallococcus exiguus]|uniref:glutathione S-transferase family protein n=1 Tax=Corallococcus exiguus TaxID=83462 RepID=UPI0014949CD7|nr:glutathione S-transferase N-terminal domain-containing protein [Corallococcus exiguus]NPC72882.1 glutathione S-transferase family protein [Corallococcus exiguus]NPD26240.1 glutathione S-transferase family protein [Corallococcus exiguus]NRD46560.1 glutathione S-transferase N-terminal domain-containing protein [Corallococcus exiguus]